MSHYPRARSLLGPKTESLLELGMAATIGCDDCIAHHVEDALRAGADETEIRQTIELARRLGGSPSFDCCDRAEGELVRAERELEKGEEGT